jgi:hypothetical protein
MEYFKVPNYSCAHGYKIKKTEIERIDFDLCKQPTETLEAYYKRQTVKPDLLSNCGFFDTANGNTIFTYANERKVISYDSTLSEGIGTKDDGSLVLGKWDSTYKDFICGYPVLIKEGKAVNSKVGSEIDYLARRTILGYDDNYVYLIVVELPGYRFSKVKEMLLSLGVKNAVNLDGGGSSRILENGNRVTDVVYSRPIDNVLAIYLKKEKVIYRVQTGAFGRKENAENYLALIKKLDDSIGAGYANAYIRTIDGLYKIQIGAFSKKENAERVMNDLKNKGYNAFITTK